MSQHLLATSDKTDKNTDAVQPPNISAADIFAGQSKPLSELTGAHQVAAGVLPDLALSDSTMAAATKVDYAKSLTSDNASLAADLKALQGDKKGTSTYEADLTRLNRDESSLHDDVMAWRKNAPDFKTFSSVMEAEHTDLKHTAKGLWDMGLKDQASQTTAYYPLSHYAKYFDKSGDPGSPGGPTGGGDTTPPKNATVADHLDTASQQRPNMKADQIGGSGDVQGSSVTQIGPDTTRFTLTGGHWADGLWSIGNKSDAAKNANHIKLDADFTLTANDLKNDHEIEKDIVVQKADGSYGTAGTQINPKTGEVDYWNTQKSQWINVGSLGPLEANKDYHLEMGVTVHDTGNANTGTYNYDYYSLNGQKLDATKTMFNTKPMNWSAGVYIQTQLDLPNVPDGSIAGLTESNQKLYLWQ